MTGSWLHSRIKTINNMTQKSSRSKADSDLEMVRTEDLEEPEWLKVKLNPGGNFDSPFRRTSIVERNDVPSGSSGGASRENSA